MGKKKIKVVDQKGIPTWIVLLIILALGTIFVMLYSVLNPAYGVECPEGHKCLTDEQAAELSAIVRERQCQDRVLDEIEKNGSSEGFKLKYNPYTIIITPDGQVYDQEDMTGTLTWCNTELQLRTKPNLRVLIKEKDPHAEKTWGFRLRVRLGVNVWPKTLLPGAEDAPLLEPALALEPFFVRKFHVLTWAGFNTVGLGLGLDITKNADVYAGVGGRWSNRELGPVFGLSLSFN